MTERLDRIETLLETTGQQQAKQTEDIDTLLGAIAQTDRQVSDLRGESADAKQRFEVLRLEAQKDRDDSRERFDAVIAQAEADREESRRRFDAQQENIQRLFVELINVSRDNSRLRDRVDSLEQAS